MIQNRGRKAALLLIWAASIAAAMACRLVPLVSDGAVFPLARAVRAGIYLTMYALWGISLRHHVAGRAVKNWLSAIVALMLFWFLVRTVKFNTPDESVWNRYLSIFPQKTSSDTSGGVVQVKASNIELIKYSDNIVNRKLIKNNFKKYRKNT
ncbi:MAG: hypothetical protein SO005_11035 [Candidatus Choladocola sp.]|nr:hypothetical protein [Candidatus Choladocola sp.]